MYIQRITSAKIIVLTSLIVGHLFPMNVYQNLRDKMVEFQIHRRGVKDESILTSMKSVPRHMFVPEHLQREAYDDNPLPIGCGQTISQPYIVAVMLDAAKLKPTDKILEIGTGCGYSAAVASNIVSSVYTVENIKELADPAVERLKLMGYDNVHVRCGDGSVGWAEYGPYDKIIVTAAAPTVPPSLKAQLTINGKMIIPVSENGWGEDLVRVTKLEDGSCREEALTSVRFVPLVGKEGYPRGH